MNYPYAKTKIHFVYSAESFRLLHPNGVGATHDPRYSPGVFYRVYVKNGALFDQLQGRSWETQGFRRGWTPMYICIYIYTYQIQM